MRFYKVHVLGNDFVLFDGRFAGNVDWSALAKAICNRHTGVGADGMLVLLPAEKADVRMRVIGADGVETNVGGCDILAFARCCFVSGAVHGASFSVETVSGVLQPQILLKNGRVVAVRVDIGEPLLDAADIPANTDGRAVDLLLIEDGRTFPFTAMRVGTPHAAVFVDSADETDVKKYGPLIESDPMFPEHASVDFVEVLSKDRIRIRTWIRGHGDTLASGAGACAAAVACVLGGKTGRTVAVEFTLGRLLVEWSEENDHLFLTGSAQIVFSGFWNV